MDDPAGVVKATLMATLMARHFWERGPLGFHVRLGSAIDLGSRVGSYHTLSSCTPALRCKRRYNADTAVLTTKLDPGVKR